MPEQTYYAQYTDLSAGVFPLTGPDAEPTDIALIKDVSGENIKGISLEWVLEDSDCPSTVADVTHASFTALVICPEEGKEAPEDDPYYLKDEDPCNPTVTIIDQAGCPQTARSDKEIAMNFGILAVVLIVILLACCCCVWWCCCREKDDEDEPERKTAEDKKNDEEQKKKEMEMAEQDGHAANAMN